MVNSSTKLVDKYEYKVGVTRKKCEKLTTS